MGNVCCVGSCSWKGCKECKGCSGFTKCKFDKCKCCSGLGKSNCCADFTKCNCCAGFTKSNCCTGFTKCNWCQKCKCPSFSGCRKCKCAPFSGCRKCKCSCAWCAGLSCAGLACCVACRKALRSCCPSCFPEKTKKAKKDDSKDSKASVTYSNSTRSSPVQTKPPHQERIVKEQCRPTNPIENRWQPPPQRTPSPPRRVEEQPKHVVLPTPRSSSSSSSPSPPPRRVEEPPVIPMSIKRTPSPPRRVREEPRPAVIPITTTPSPPPPQRVKKEPRPPVSPRPTTSGDSSKQDGTEKTKKPHNVRRKAASAGLQGDVLQIKTGHLKEYYNLGQKLGQGQFGITFHCVEKGTGKEYACKSIVKRKLMTKDDVEDVRREIQIMHHLSGHPNIIKIKGAYEDAVAVHVVMELCKGGELFDRIVERGHYSERKAAELSRIIVGVVQSCHSLGVMHRDLKPENFLFVNEMEESPLQTIDFGLSIFFKPGDIFHDVVGSPYYVAPEVLDRNYGPEADVWSAGVIIYILLCGVPPFWAEAEEDIFEEVLNGELDFSDDPWPEISKSAKDLLMKMLVRNPRKRITAPDVLRHPWIHVDGVAPDKPLDSVLRRLNQFSAMNKIKKMALRVIAEKLSVDEIAGLKEMFKMIDTDNSGQITFEEFKAGLKNFGHNLDDTAMRDLMKSADVDNSGTIDYGEFIAATLHLNKVEREDYLFAAFSYFDKDGSGYITPDELQKACQEFGIEDSRLADMIQEVDQNNDGCIDYNEFVAMMQSGNLDLGKKGK